MSTGYKHLIIACVHGHHGLVSLGYTTFILQLQRVLAQRGGKVKVHVHMFKTTEQLMEQARLLCSGQESAIHIGRDVSLKDIFIAHIPSNFGMDPNILFDVLEDERIQNHVMVLPYPMSTYDLKGAVADGTVDPDKAVRYNVPGSNGIFPEEPEVYICSLTAFICHMALGKYVREVGRCCLFTYPDDRKVCITNTQSMAFIGCAANRIGSFLR